MPRPPTRNAAAQELHHRGHLAAIGQSKSGQWQAHYDEIGKAYSTSGISGGSSQRGDQFDEQFYKTQVCTLWRQGCCRRRVCRFAHGEAELRRAPDLTRTAMCRLAMQGRTCEDPTCSYAHHLHEVRATGTYYKTAMCSFARRGSCKLGDQCRYAHAVDELRSHTEPDEPGSRSDTGSPRDERSLASSILVEWETASGSERDYAPQPNCAKPDAQLHAQGRAMNVPVMHYLPEVAQSRGAGLCLETQLQSAQRRMRKCSHQAEVRPRYLLGPPLMGGEPFAACERDCIEDPVQDSVLVNGEYVQKRGLSQAAGQMQQTPYQPPHVVSGHAGTLCLHASHLEPEIHISTKLPQRGPDSGEEASGVRLHSWGGNLHGSFPFENSTNAALLAPVADIAESVTRPSAGIPRAQVTPQQPPSWQPTIPCPVAAPSSPATMQVHHHPDSRPTNPAEAILREMQARILKAAMPDYYED